MSQSKADSHKKRMDALRLSGPHHQALLPPKKGNPKRAQSSKGTGSSSKAAKPKKQKTPSKRANKKAAGSGWQTAKKVMKYGALGGLAAKTFLQHTKAGQDTAYLLGQYMDKGQEYLTDVATTAGVMDAVPPSPFQDQMAGRTPTMSRAEWLKNYGTKSWSETLSGHHTETYGSFWRKYS